MEIYKTTNKITGQYYIGLNTTSNPDYLGSGVEIKKQVKKYGKENFIKEILCLVTSSSTDENILRKIEHAYISNHIKHKMCINRSLGYQKDKKLIETKYIQKIVEVEKIVEVDTYKDRYEKMQQEVITLSRMFGIYKRDGITPFDGYGAKRKKKLSILEKQLEHKEEYLNRRVQKSRVIGRNLSALLNPLPFKIT